MESCVAPERRRGRARLKTGINWRHINIGGVERGHRGDLRRETRPSCGAKGSTLDERLFDDEVTGLAVAALDEAAALQHQAQFVQHRRAAAHHDAVGIQIESWLTDVAE